jgi:hypothetical protein
MKLFAPIVTAALLLAGPGAATAQEQFGEWDLTVPQVQQMVETVRGQMLQPGERVSGWDRGGANPVADLRATGADGHYFRLRGPHGDGIGILDGRSIASVAPPAWRVIDTYGSAAAEADNPWVQFEALSARFIIAMRAEIERRGDVDCASRITDATLYERPDAPVSEADDSVRLLFRVLLLAIEDQTVCTRYEGNREEGYRSLSFLPDGRSLPIVNQDVGHMTIIPAGPIEQLVTYTEVDGAT